MPFLEECTVIETAWLNDDVYSMYLNAPELTKTARPGQFIAIKCGADMVLRRPFAISDVDKTVMRVVFERRGKGTARLSQMTTGSVLNVLGPLGNGFSPVPEGKILLAAGGIGAAPLLFAAGSLGKRADIALGFRSANAAILTDEFILRCGKTLVTSDDGSIGDRGFTDALCEKMLTENKYSQVLACGPPKMLEAVSRVAEARNIPCKVSLEERMGCGVGACLVCACKIKAGSGYKYSHVCKDGPVFDSREVAWNA